MPTKRAGWTRYSILVALLGLVVYLALHLLFIASWTHFFTTMPWPGYEDSTRLGLVEPWFVNTPRSLWLTRTVMFATAFGVSFVSHRTRWSAAAALWLGAATGIAATWATTSGRTLDGGELGYFLYPFRVLLPILLGTALAALARRTIVRTGTGD